jgi:hypothetical protein
MKEILVLYVSEGSENRPFQIFDSPSADNIPFLDFGLGRGQVSNPEESFLDTFAIPKTQFCFAIWQIFF